MELGVTFKSNSETLESIILHRTPQM